MTENQKAILKRLNDELEKINKWGVKAVELPKESYPFLFTNGH